MDPDPCGPGSGWENVTAPCQAASWKTLLSAVSMNVISSLEAHQDGAMHVGATHQWCHCLQWGVVAADHDGYAARESPMSKGWQP